MKRLARFLLFLLLIILLLAGFVFTLNNSTAVPLWLGIDFAPKPLGVWILLAFVSGGLLGLLLGIGLWRRFRSRLELSQLRAQLRAAEKEIGVLKQQLLPRLEYDAHPSFRRKPESGVVPQPDPATPGTR